MTPAMPSNALRGSLFAAFLCMGLWAATAKAQIRSDLAAQTPFALAMLMELDIRSAVRARDDLYLGQTTYRPSIQFEWVPSLRTYRKDHSVNRRRVELAGANEVSFSRDDRLFSAREAELERLQIWTSTHFVMRSVYGVLAIEWLRLRGSVGGARLIVSDKIASVSNRAWQFEIEGAALAGLRVFSFLVVQGGISYVHAFAPFRVGDNSNTSSLQRTTLGAARSDLAGVLRVGIEYRFGQRRQKTKSEEDD